MVAMSPIRRTHEAGSPPSHAMLPNLVVDDSKHGNADSDLAAEQQHSDNLPHILSSSTTTAQEDSPKAPLFSSLMDSAVSEEEEEEEIVLSKDDSADDGGSLLPEESYHLVTPVKPESVSTLGNWTCLQDSVGTMEEEEVFEEEAEENAFYSTRQVIAEVDDEATTDGDDEAASDVVVVVVATPPLRNSQRSVASSSSKQQSVVKVRTVEENVDDDDSETTVTVEDDDEKNASGSGATTAAEATERAPPTAMTVEKADDTATLSAVTPESAAKRPGVDELDQSFSWDETELIQLEPSNSSVKEFELSVDWGDSCDFDELTLDDSQDFEDVRRSATSLMSRGEDKKIAGLVRPQGAAPFCGRQEELQKLQNALSLVMSDSSTTTNPTIFWISGITDGIGKTALMNEFIRRVPDGPIVCQGSFAEDLVLSPFHGVILCFRDLLDIMMNKDMIGQRRTQIRDALGDDIYLLVSLIPSLATVLDTDDQVRLSDEIGEDDDRFGRLKRGLGRLLSLICAESVVIFAIDDMQWVDEDSLKLIESLLTTMKHPRFMFLGCHRRIKVSHPLCRLKAKISTEVVADIRLPNLDPQSDMTHTSYHLSKLESSERIPLSQQQLAASLPPFFQEEGDGNPFFSIQLAFFLHQKKALRLNEDHWDLDSDFEIPSTAEQVVSGRLSLLSEDEILVSRSAALLGTQTFNSKLLAVAVAALAKSDKMSSTLPPKKIEELMKELHRRMLFHKYSEGIYAFESQIIYKVALSTVSSSPKRLARLHVSLALELLRLKFEDTNGDFQEAAEAQHALIAYHFGKGALAMDTLTDKASVTSTMFQVAESFMAKGSYATAVKFLEIALGALGSSSPWRDAYKKSLKIHLALSRCQYHCGNMDKAKQYANAIIANAQEPRDKIGGFRLLASICRARRQYDLSKNVMVKALGEIWNESLISLQIEEKLSEVRGLVHAKSDTDLLIIDEMTHRKTRAKMPFLMELADVCGVCQDFRLQDLAALRILELTLRYGSFGQNFTGLAFALCGVCLGRRRLHGEAYRYGHLAEMMSDLESSLGRQAVMHHHYLLRFWRFPVLDSPEILSDICRISLRQNNLAQISSELRAYLSTVLVAGKSLAFDETILESYQKVNKQNAFADSWTVFLPYNLIMRLTGSDSGTITEVNLNGTKAVQYDLFYQMVAAVFFQDMDTAADLNAQLLIRPNGVHVPFGAFFEGLISAHQVRHSFGTEKVSHQKKATKMLELLTLWAKNGVPDISCMANILRIEVTIANEMQLPLEKVGILYDAAIESALGNTSIAALACERAGLYFIAQDDKKMAANFLSRSHRLYQTWGAVAKVEQLNSIYGALVNADAELPKALDQESLFSFPRPMDYGSTKISPKNDVSQDLMNRSEAVPSQSFYGSALSNLSVPAQSINTYQQSFQNPRDGFQRISSDRALDSRMNPVGRRDAFQRVASDRMLLTQRQATAWPSSNPNHHPNPQIHSHNLQYPLGLQPPQPYFAAHHPGFGIQQQQIQQQQYQGHFPMINHPHHQQYMISSPNFPQQIHEQYHYQLSQQPNPQYRYVLPPGQQHRQNSQGMSSPLSLNTGRSQFERSQIHVDAAVAAQGIPAVSSVPSSHSPSSPKKRGKRRVRSKSTPGRMPKNGETVAAIPAESSKKSKQKSMLGNTWAELKEDFHPKSFLKDMNFGKKKKTTTGSKDSVEIKITPSDSLPRKERPSMTGLASWSVRSWSSRRRATLTERESEDEPELRRRLKSKTPISDFARTKKPGKAEASASTKEDSVANTSESLPSSNKSKANAKKAMALAALKKPTSPKKRKSSLDKAAHEGLDLPVSSNTNEIPVHASSINTPVSPTKKKGALKSTAADGSPETASPKKKKGIAKKNDATKAMKGTESPKKKKGLVNKVASDLLVDSTAVGNKDPNAADTSTKLSVSAKMTRGVSKKVFPAQTSAVPPSPKKKKGAARKLDDSGNPSNGNESNPSNGNESRASQQMSAVETHEPPLSPKKKKGAKLSTPTSLEESKEPSSNKKSKSDDVVADTMMWVGSQEKETQSGKGKKSNKKTKQAGKKESEVQNETETEGTKKMKRSKKPST